MSENLSHSWENKGLKHFNRERFDYNSTHFVVYRFLIFCPMVRTKLEASALYMSKINYFQNLTPLFNHRNWKLFSKFALKTPAKRRKLCVIFVLQWARIVILKTCVSQLKISVAGSFEPFFAYRMDKSCPADQLWCPLKKGRQGPKTLQAPCRQ